MAAASERALQRLRGGDRRRGRYGGIVLAVEAYRKDAEALFALPGKIIFLIWEKVCPSAIRAKGWVIAVGVRLTAKIHCRSSSSARKTQWRNCSPSSRCSLYLLTKRMT